MKNRWLTLGLIICVLIAVLLKDVSPKTGERSSHFNSDNLKKTETQLNARRRSIARADSQDSKSEFQTLEGNILALLASDNPVDINKVYNDLIPALVKMDPKAAVDFSQSPEAAQWRSELMMTVVQNWAKITPADAQEWASNLSNPPDNPAERDTMVSYVSFAVADMDAKRAVQVLEQCPINKDRFEIVVENLAQQLADQGALQPLVDLVGKMPESSDRDGYFARIANAMARNDVTKAATLVSEDITPGPAQADAAIAVIRQWAWNDKSGARNWVESFPPGEVRDRALNEWADIVAKREGVN